MQTKKRFCLKEESILFTEVGTKENNPMKIKCPISCTRNRSTQMDQEQFCKICLKSDQFLYSSCRNVAKSTLPIFIHDKISRSYFSVQLFFFGRWLSAEVMEASPLCEGSYVAVLLSSVSTLYVEEIICCRGSFYLKQFTVQERSIFICSAPRIGLQYIPEVDFGTDILHQMLTLRKQPCRKASPQEMFPPSCRFFFYKQISTQAPYKSLSSVKAIYNCSGSRRPKLLMSSL